VSSLPSLANYGTTFQVATTAAADITSVAALRPAAITHNFDQNQRYIPLNFVVDNANSITVTAPAAENTPPGDYMLFLLNNNGVPSVAEFIHFGPPDADADGSADVDDNCPNVPNTALNPDPEGWAPQQDDDGDGIGNACDLVVTTRSLPSARAGKPYSQQLFSDRGTPPFIWDLYIPGNFEPDFGVTPDGLISGETQPSFVKSFTVRVTDATGDTAIQALTIRVTIPNCMSCHSTLQ